MAAEKADKRSPRSPWKLRFLVSLLIALGFWLALRRYIDVVPQTFTLESWTLPAYLATLLPYFVLRNARWWLLVRALRPQGPGFILTTATGFAGMMWIMLLPLRLGEFARPLFLAQRSDISVSESLGTVALERVTDGLIACACFFLGLWVLEPTAPHNGAANTSFESLRMWGLLGTGLLFSALFVLLAMARWPTGLGRVVAAPLRLVPPLARAVEGLTTGLATGLAALSPLRHLLPFAIVSVAYWAVNAAGMAILASGCGLPLSYLEATTVMGVLALTLLIPGGPAQFGNFQLGLILGLGLFLEVGGRADQTSTFIFCLYLCQLGVGVGLGLAAQLWLRPNWSTLFRRPEVEATQPDAGSTS